MQKFEIELNETQASALAQLIKRITFSDVRGCAASESEAYEMMEALNLVRDSLAEGGFAPR